MTEKWNSIKTFVLSACLGCGQAMAAPSVLPQLLPEGEKGVFQQWALSDNIARFPGAARFTLAWDTTVGSSDITIAVIDSGVLPHPEIRDRLLPGYDFISDPLIANDGDGRDADASDPGSWVSEALLDTGVYPQDCSVRHSIWHGTEITGVIAASAFDQMGIVGGDWHAKILPVRAMGRCGGYQSDLADAIRWSAGLPVDNLPNNPFPADIINLSLGSLSECGAVEQAAINAANAVGTLIIVAAGNGGSDLIGDLLSETPMSPANCDGVLVVSAVNRDGQLSKYGNYGPQVDLLAPGGTSDSAGILTTSDSGRSAPNHDTYRRLSFGTSLATPYVSAAAALVMAQNNDLSADEVQNILISTSRPLPKADPRCEQGCGAGLLDAAAAVSAAAKIQAQATVTSAPDVSAAHTDDRDKQPQSAASAASQGDGGGSGGGGSSSIALLLALLIPAFIRRRARLRARI